MSEVKGTKALELWCKRLVKDCPDVHIDNMTTSWRNGIAFCALVHHFRPDLIDLSKLNPDNIYDNNQLAYNIAEKHLGIPALLDPEDMVENDVPDRLSILTYLSQFYQRLGHTVNTKVNDSDSKVSSTTSTPSSTPIKFGKVALDKCTVCGLPVYLAQRLIVSQKLYHRRCFRCSTCLGHLNPKNFHVIELNKFSCDSCKNDKSMSKYLNNNDQMGMLAFTNDAPATRQDTQQAEPNSSKLKARPQSILEKISMFEKNIEKDSVNKMDENFSNISLKDNYLNKYTDVSTSNYVNDSNVIEPQKVENICTSDSFIGTVVSNPGSNNHTPTLPEKVYKTNKDKFNFLQTQLSDDTPDTVCIPDVKYNSDFTDIKFTSDTKTISDTKFMPDIKFISDKKGISDVKFLPDTKFVTNTEYNIPDTKLISDTKLIPDIKFVSDTKFIQDTAIETNVTHINDVLLQKEDKVNIDQSENILTKTNENNITDDSRLAQNNLSLTKDSYIEKDVLNDENIKISVPPRRKKQNAIKKVLEKSVKETSKPNVEYPVHLNPFSEDEDENEDTEKSRNISTNPFGSSDEEEEIEHQKQPSPPKNQSQPVKRLIKACNPFWSDGEEPSSDEETTSRSANMHKSSLTTSTPNLPGSTPRRRKPKAPAPPPIISEHLDVPSTSMDDVASISSFSSHTSTVHSDQKSCGTYTPKSRKRRPAPTPPDSLSTLSGCGENLDRSVDSPSGRNNSDGAVRRVKGPAPGLPLPERREVKMQMLPEELQVQLDLLETQQLGLERQGVLIEQMIRDKCEGDDGPTAPQEEIEDLVIQLCELVNEKNDLFRKQTELMYIRRQQRLEQEQADIEHEIRVIQSRPAVNRIDADKVREEQLVARLVQVVLLRDELVQQMDAERRRERQEDLAIAASIASKRAQRNSESNSSSMKSADTTPVKKSKVKDKVKKQLKKAKHTLISKKKDEDKPEKEKKSK